MQQTKQQPEDMLMKALGFSDDDLKVNRAGRMSKPQRARLKYIFAKRLIFVLVGVILGVISIFLLRDNPSVGRAIAEQENSGIWLGLLGLGYGAGIVYVVVKWGQTFRGDLSEGRVYVAKGYIHLTVIRNRGQVVGYLMYLGHLSFQIDNKVFDALWDGDAYAVYYSPRRKVLLAAEPLWWDEESEGEPVVF